MERSCGDGAADQSQRAPSMEVAGTAAEALDAKLAAVAALVLVVPLRFGIIFNVTPCLLQPKSRERRSRPMRSRAPRGVRSRARSKRARARRSPRGMQVASHGWRRSRAGRAGGKTAAASHRGRAAHRGARRGECERRRCGRRAGQTEGSDRQSSRGRTTGLIRLDVAPRHVNSLTKHTA